MVYLYRGDIGGKSVSLFHCKPQEMADQKGCKIHTSCDKLLSIVHLKFLLVAKRNG